MMSNPSLSIQETPASELTQVYVGVGPDVFTIRVESPTPFTKTGREPQSVITLRRLVREKFQVLLSRDEAQAILQGALRESRNRERSWKKDLRYSVAHVQLDLIPLEVGMELREWINQAYREVQVIEIKPKRYRIEYAYDAQGDQDELIRRGWRPGVKNHQAQLCRLHWQVCSTRLPISKRS